MSDDADAAARQIALNPDHSFIVQAPAGSGKTELLIQRHLLLLARVQYPEQVVAVTFTRKAAAEMRSRVIDMLELAAAGSDSVSPHRLKSLELAAAVLERDRDLDWGLLERPGRLRIDTVDALNSWLAERLPIASGGMAGANVQESAALVYRRAAARALDAALAGGPQRSAAAQLLEGADNSIETLIKAVGAVMPMRDQWLNYLVGTDDAALRAAITRGLEHLAATKLARARACCGSETLRELQLLIDHAQAHAARPQSDHVDGGAASAAEGELYADYIFWRAVAALLLTQSGTWRKRFTRSEGFAPEYRAEKARIVATVDLLRDVPGMLDSLTAIAQLPPLAPSNVQIERAVAARSILLQSLAELKLIFQEDHTVDFLELALGAQAALGALDAPSELLLALDRRIEHLLVDEFQDTSHSQLRLLELLTAGWSEGDGRTLFLVGDPMQSIYRFRDADMRLFLRVKAQGLGNVKLQHLVLRRNFRSAPAVVDWVNDTFSKLFPDADDPETGRAAYYPFESAHEPASGDCVILHRMPGPALTFQHREVVRIAAEELRRSDSTTVAVLVQSRSHLRGLKLVLNALNVPVRAVELDTLSEQPVVQDLLALTRALLHRADRIAWLALLRGPWVGLSWTDLHAIANVERSLTIWEILALPATADLLSDAGAALRVRFFIDRLTTGFHLRGRYSLPQWIECCWQLLDGPATLATVAEFEQVRKFLSVLDTAVSEGDVPDPAELTRSFEIPFSDAAGEAGQANPGRALEIMTIHRAKGLEFDAVILFGLDRRVRGSDPKLIYWDTFGANEPTSGVLLAAMSTNEDPLVRYLQRVDRDLDRAERARLLYVAVTRAKRRLHLIGHLGEETNGSDGAAAGSLMSWLSSQFRELDKDESLEEGDDLPEQPWIVTPLIALEDHDGIPVGPLASRPLDIPSERPVYDWASLTAAHVGTVVHRALQKISVTTAPEGVGLRQMVAPDTTEFEQELRLLGVPPKALPAAGRRVREILESVQSDPQGQWILGAHSDAQSELALAVLQRGEVSHLQIDRTFIDRAGTRWIIDYKTSRHAGGDLDLFIAAELERYRDQLETYARALYRIDARPIRVGLYFPVLGVFRDWVPSVCADG